MEVKNNDIYYEIILEEEINLRKWGRTEGQAKQEIMF
jgi:hypothetical protein